jgi:hypothetical protein
MRCLYVCSDQTQLITVYLRCSYVCSDQTRLITVYMRCSYVCSDQTRLITVYMRCLYVCSDQTQLITVYMRCLYVCSDQTQLITVFPAHHTARDLILVWSMINDLLSTYNAVAFSPFKIAVSFSSMKTFVKTTQQHPICRLMAKLATRCGAGCC